MRTTLATALVMLATVAYAADAPTSAQCQSMWTQASNGSQSIPQSQASTYVSNFKQADQDGNGQLSSAEFMTACQGGLVNISRLPANQ